MESQKSRKQSSKKPKHSTPADAVPVPETPASAAAMLIGKSVSAADAIAQADTSQSLGVTHAVPLEQEGWSPADNGQIGSQKQAFKEADEAYKDARIAKKAAAAAFAASMTMFLFFREKLVTALRIATQGQGNVFKPVALHRSTTTSPRLLARWFGQVLGLVKANEAALETQFGPAPTALVKAYAERLEKEHGDWLAAKQTAQKATAVHAAKARLVMLIDRQRLTAQIAFQGDPDTISQFTPIWQSRKKRKKKATNPVQTTDGSSAASAKVQAEPAAEKPAAVDPKAAAT